MKNTLTLVTGDALKLPIPDNSVDLIITHPPYLGVDTQRYGGDEAKQINSDAKKMIKLLRKMTEEAFRVLRPGGHMIICNGPGMLIDVRYVADIFDRSNLVYADKVVVNSYATIGREDNQHIAEKTTEKIMSELIATWYHFMKPGDVYSDPFKVKKYNNPVWNIRFNNMDDPIDKKLFEDGHFVVDAMNKEIPKRFIEMFSKQGDVVLDLFGGSAVVGTTALALNRSAISNDISEEQSNIAEIRAKMMFGDKIESSVIKL
jgi:DNA modification methylase